MRTIAIVNQKGGCGKTTTVINLAAICARRGLRTLIIDMDPQSHCAAGLGVPDDALEQSIGPALLRDLSKPLDRASLIWEVARNLDLAPSTMSLAALEAPGGGLHELEDRDRRLALLLRHLSQHYDRCFIDCPPTIGLLTYNALRAAGEAIIPVQTEYFALRGARRQWETIRNLVESVDHPISCYVLPTLFDESERIERDIFESIRKQFRGRVIPIVIRDHAAIREAAAFGQPVVEYAAESDAVRDFEALADWLDDHPADPPEIQVDVKQSITLPFAGLAAAAAVVANGAAEAPRSGAAGETASVPGEVSSRRVAAATAAPNRAAEMAQRVRDLAARARGGSGGGARTAMATADAQRSPTSISSPSAPAQEPNHTPVREKRRYHPLVLHAEQAKAMRLPMPPAARSPRAAAPPPRSTAPAPSASGPAIRTVAEAREVARHRRSALIEQKGATGASAHSVAADVVRLFGVRQTTHGVLFVQPGVPGMRISVAGDFNDWSPTATSLRFNPDTGAFELLLPLDRGEHQYRLVIDGQWQTDPYNRARRRNQFGEDNNIIVVE